MGDCATFDVILRDDMDLHIETLGTIAQERPCYVFYAKRCEVYWDMTHCGFVQGTQIWYYKFIHTNAHIHRNACSTHRE